MKHFFSSKICAFLVFTILLPTISLSQVNSIAVGLNITSEFESTLQNGTLGLGVTIEKQLTKHSGIASGVYYRTCIIQTRFITNTAVYDFSVSEKYLSFPLLYKYYSGIVNLSVGPTVDYFAGWRQTSGTGGVKVDSHDVYPNFAFGIMAKVSKNFPLNKQLFVEPELRYNRIFPTLRNYFGLGISMKYRL